MVTALPSPSTALPPPAVQPKLADIATRPLLAAASQAAAAVKPEAEWVAERAEEDPVTPIGRLLSAYA